MKDFDELLDEAAVDRETKRETATVEILVGKSLVNMKFTELDTMVWADITSAHPFRADAPLDIQYGYNVHTASEAAAEKSGVRVDGDVEAVVSPEQWKKLWKAIETPARKSITDAIWSLNEFAPSQRLAKAKKAWAVDSKRKPSSPAN